MKFHTLPPLNSLVAFESAARHLSFTLAAQELCVTQGAVSRQVHLLEDYLGKSLFERTTRSMSLSPTGNLYYAVVRESLLQVAGATSEIRHWRGAQQVTIATSTAIAALWLLPRVGEFQRNNEDLDLRIIASDHVKDYTRLDCDLALYYCRTRPQGMHVTPLFTEEVFPVCSPDYLTRHPELQGIEHFTGCTLLRLDDPQSDWIGWSEWFQRLGHTMVEPRHRININSYSMLLQSAASGQGIALAWSNLVGNYLQTGALVRPVAATLNTDGQFCLLEPNNRPATRQGVKRFRSWLLEELPVSGEPDSTALPLA